MARQCGWHEAASHARACAVTPAATQCARIRSAEYMNATKLFTQDAIPIDVRISPEQLVTEYVERLIHHPGSLQVLDFADGRVRLVGLRARKGKAVNLDPAALLMDMLLHINETSARLA